MTNDLRRRISSKKLTDEDVAVEMTESNTESAQRKQKRVSLTAGIANLSKLVQATMAGPPTPRTRIRYHLVGLSK